MAQVGNLSGRAGPHLWHLSPHGARAAAGQRKGTPEESKRETGGHTRAGTKKGSSYGGGLFPMDNRGGGLGQQSGPTNGQGGGWPGEAAHLSISSGTPNQSSAQELHPGGDGWDKEAYRQHLQNRKSSPKLCVVTLVFRVCHFN